MPDFWKEDWDLARERFGAWWRREGLALHVTAPKDEPWADIPPPVRPVRLEDAWCDPVYRVQSSLRHLANTYHGGVAFPSIDTLLGPGSLGSFLGSNLRFAEDTVWYEPLAADPDEWAPLRFDPNSPWFRCHLAIIEEGLRAAQGRCLVGIPDLIENIDTLAQLRDPQALMLDLVERPAWVLYQLDEINQAFFDSFDAIADKTRDRWGGTTFAAFALWGLGRTAKIQCDASAMFSPAMFREFVVPSMTEQCRWLDHSLYHLDGTQAMGHLEALLAIEELDAIEWTPQAGIEGGGNPRWYDLYRHIRAAGKGVQAVGVAYDEVLPLIDAVGAEGLFIVTWAPTEAAARDLVERAS